MDAVVFQKEWASMCRSYDDCKDCPLRLSGCSDGLGASVDIAKKRVEIVEKWSVENPKKTNGQVMFDYIQKFVNDTNGGFTSLTMSPRIILEFDQGWWCKEYKE